MSVKASYGSYEEFLREAEGARDTLQSPVSELLEANLQLNYFDEVRCELPDPQRPKRKRKRL